MTISKKTSVITKQWEQKLPQECGGDSKYIFCDGKEDLDSKGTVESGKSRDLKKALTMVEK